MKIYVKKNIMAATEKDSIDCYGVRKKQTADKSAQSHASGGRVHVCPAGHTCARSRESAGFRH